MSRKLFVPRLTNAGMATSKYYHDEKYNSLVGDVSYPNCTLYCLGRLAELYDRNIADDYFENWIGNAKTWHSEIISDRKRSDKPVLGAIACFDGTYGHVAIVEMIEGKNVTISYQEKNGTKFSIVTEQFKVGTKYPKYGWGAFQGYVYPKDEFYIVETKTIDELATEVYKGLWGNGKERYERLTDAGFDYYKVQARVEEKYYSNKTKIKVGDNVKVKKGAKWYNGESIDPWVFAYIFDVIEVKGERVVIGTGNDVTGAIDKDNLKVVK